LLNRLAKDSPEGFRSALAAVHKLRDHKTFKSRQLFLRICDGAVGTLNTVVFERELLPSLLQLAADPTPNVRLSVGKLTVSTLARIEPFASHEITAQILKLLEGDKDVDVSHFGKTRVGYGLVNDYVVHEDGGAEGGAELRERDQAIWDALQAALATLPARAANADEEDAKRPNFGGEESDSSDDEGDDATTAMNTEEIEVSLSSGEGEDAAVGKRPRQDTAMVPPAPDPAQTVDLGEPEGGGEEEAKESTASVTTPVATVDHDFDMGGGRTRQGTTIITPEQMAAAAAHYNVSPLGKLPARDDDDADVPMTIQEEPDKQEGGKVEEETTGSLDESLDVDMK
jgi:hypothetical protein